MERALFHNEVIPTEQVLTHLAESVVQQTLKRFRDICGRGIRSGLRVTVNTTNGLTFDISAGAGYTPRGELIELSVPITGLALDQVSTLTLSTSEKSIAVRGNGSYDPTVGGGRSYVLLRYIEETSHPGRRRDNPDLQFDQIARGRFEIEVLTATDFAQLTQNDSSDASAVQDLTSSTVGLPTDPPFPSRQYRLLLAVVTPRGEGVSLRPSDIREGDPGVTQPQDLPGVQIVNVSPQTPTGTGFLRWRVKDQTLSWQAPADTGSGPALDLPTDPGIYVLESKSSVNESVSLRVSLDPASVRALTTDVEEPISVVPRLELTFPQPSQADPAISGVTVRTVSTNLPVGDTTLTYDRVAQTLVWDVVGSGSGPAVNVSGGGNFTIRPGPIDVTTNKSMSPYTMSVFVHETALPGGTGTLATTVTIQGLYDQDIPLAHAMDLLHRSFVGRGIPTARNPHATTIEDIFEAGGEDILATHQDLYHVNGISIDASPDFLRATVTPDDRVQVVPSQSNGDRFLVQGVTYDDVKNTDVQFTDADETGYWLVYVNQDAVLTRARICAAPDWSPIAYADALPAKPPIRIIEARRSTTSGSSGRLSYRPGPRNFFWRGPGSSTFGPKVNAAEDITLYDGQNPDDYIRLQIDLSRLRLDLPATGSPINIDIQWFTDANTVNVNNTLPLFFGLWDQGSGGIEAFIDGATSDLRRFATADVAQKFFAVLRDLSQTTQQRTLYERLVQDRRENLDCGISTKAAHSTVLDTDPAALFAFQTSNSAKVAITQPSTDTVFHVDGRRYEAIVYDPSLPPGRGGGGYGPAGAPPSVTDLTPRWDFTVDTPDNQASAPEAACLYQLYVDEFGRLNAHVRVLEDEDATTKTIPAWVISDISPDFPAGAASLRLTINAPTASFYQFELRAPNDSDFGEPSISQRIGRTVRCYAQNGRDWVEVTNIFALAPPGASATATFTVFAPIDDRNTLELVRASYDGSAELVRLIDQRRFGSVGRRSLANDALALNSKLVRDGLYGETRSSGVIRGLDLTFSRGDAQVSWTGGVVTAGEYRIEVAAGQFTNTVPGVTGLRNRYMFVDPDGSVNFSGGHGEAHVQRLGVLVAILYIQNNTVGIDYIEDRRFFPALVPQIPSRQILALTRQGQMYVRTGILHGSDFSAPLTEFPTGTNSITDACFSAFWSFNTHVTVGPGEQGQLFWLDDESKDGLFLAAIQNMDPSTLPDSPVSSASTGSNFAFFIVPAGQNPRVASSLIYAGGPSFPIEVRQGDISVYPTKAIELGTHLTLSNPEDGLARVDADTQGGGGGGGDDDDPLPPLIYGDALETQELGVGAGQLSWGTCLKFSVPAGGGDVHLLCCSEVLTTPGAPPTTPAPNTDDWPEIYLALRKTSDGAPNPTVDARTYAITDPNTGSTTFRDVPPNTYTAFSINVKVRSLTSGNYSVWFGLQGGLRVAITLKDSLQTTAIWTPVHASEGALT